MRSGVLFLEDFDENYHVAYKFEPCNHSYCEAFLEVVKKVEKKCSKCKRTPIGFPIRGIDASLPVTAMSTATEDATSGITAVDTHCEEDKVGNEHVQQ